MKGRLRYGTSELEAILTQFETQEERETLVDVYQISDHIAYDNRSRASGEPYHHHIYEAVRQSTEDGFNDLDIQKLMITHDAIEERIASFKELLENDSSDSGLASSHPTIEEFANAENKDMFYQSQKVVAANTFLSFKKGYNLDRETMDTDSIFIASGQVGDPYFSQYDVRKMLLLTPDYDSTISDEEKKEVKKTALETILEVSLEEADASMVIVKTYDMWHNSEDMKELYETGKKSKESVETLQERAYMLKDFIKEYQDIFEVREGGYRFTGNDPIAILNHRLDQIIERTTIQD